MSCKQVNMKPPTLIMRAMLLLLMLYKIDAKMQIVVSKQNIPVGDESLLLCKAGGDGDITWHKDGTEIEDEEKVVKIDESSSTLKITSASMQDAGKYTCHCDFDNGIDGETTIELYIYEHPSFGNTATYHEFLEGTVGIVPCLVTGAPAVDAIWLRDKQEITTAEGRRVRQQMDNTLLFEKVTRDDAGTYICQAQIRGRPIYEELAVSVVVNVPPTVLLREKEKKVLAGPYTNVSIECLVEGQPTPNITWTTPTSSDPSRHHFNSDRSQLLILSVDRTDYGEYVCTVTNKIGKSNATIMLHVFEAPEVFVSDEQLSVSLGKRVSVFCNVSGHPQPELHWLNKHNGRTLATDSGHIHVAGGEMVIDEVMPSDGGLYSCMAVSVSGNASRDVAIHTHPDMPRYVKIYPRPASALLSLKTLPINGGTEITNFVLQWRENAAEQWQETTVPVAGPLVISPLRQYTSYAVRLAGLNKVGVGLFSDTLSVRTLGMHGEPDIPIVSRKQLEVDKNTISVPLRQSDDGGMPIQHFNIQFQKDKDGAEWKEMQLSPDSESISLQDLSFGTDYLIEVTAVNANGSSLPSRFNFTIGEQPVSNSMTKGGVVAIVIVIFLLVFLAVDATCCYRNHCGLLMSIAVKLFGQKVPGLKMLGSADGSTNGELKLKGLSTPRGSMQMGGVQTKDSVQLTEVTCDKASLTKHEKTQPITA